MEPQIFERRGSAPAPGPIYFHLGWTVLHVDEEQSGLVIVETEAVYPLPLRSVSPALEAYIVLHGGEVEGGKIRFRFRNAAEPQSVQAVVDGHKRMITLGLSHVMEAYYAVSRRAGLLLYSPLGVRMLYALAYFHAVSRGRPVLPPEVALARPGEDGIIELFDEAVARAPPVEPLLYPPERPSPRHIARAMALLSQAGVIDYDDSVVEGYDIDVLLREFRLAPEEAASIKMLIAETYYEDYSDLLMAKTRVEALELLRRESMKQEFYVATAEDSETGDRYILAYPVKCIDKCYIRRAWDGRPHPTLVFRVKDDVEVQGVFRGGKEEESREIALEP